ncbi:DUF669 domain-containing protein [Ectobacillus ponti]|uniref:DUF669 domain-containing protein n=1 Tax=Ectobacillus ponti TaxID=2961894 RepID=A0AA42BQS8_9BACI|nr:DUF669 domain-containing protein [Ectobacillus ponti]MCP8969701.1 DUF669 domain-containing protein [Ectobacillus ponti]
MFKVDYSQATEFENVKPGEYEVTVVNYELKKAESGNNRVVVDYEIRSDVEQPCQGQKILYDNFTVAEKSMWRFQQASKAAQFPDGIQFGSFKEWADTFRGKHLRLVVGEREYQGKKYPEVKSFRVSEVHAPADIKISDSDVPF